MENILVGWGKFYTEVVLEADFFIVLPFEQTDQTIPFLTGWDKHYIFDCIMVYLSLLFSVYL